jgi:hypothetical protein
MQTTLQRYAPSGAFNPGIFAFALVGLMGAALLAGLYEWLFHLNPFIYAGILLTLCFSLGLGWVGSLIIERGHCRNRLVAFVLALVIGSGGLAASYGWGYRRALSEVAEQTPGVTMLQLAQEASIERWLEFRIDNGWRIRRSTIKGTGVLAIWTLEALFVLILTAAITVHSAAEPYCERCQQWTTSQDGNITGSTREDVQPLLDRGDLAALLAMPDRPEGDTSLHIQLRRHFCPQCAETAFLTVKEVRTTGSNGNEKEHKTTLIENVELSPKLNASYVQRFTSQEAASPLAGSTQ